ncbi:MAG: RNA polymerase factor sigma-54 [Gammaproteobacteria bacterium]
MLKPALQLRVGQSLSMTPQLQQAIKLLQLSSLELQQEIQQIFETNPMLEREEESAPTSQSQEASEKTEDASSNVPAEQDITATKEQISDELPIDSNWDDIYQASNVYSEAPKEPARDVYENESTGSNSLQEHLLQQIDLINLSDVDRIIGMTLIDEIDNDGYLTDSVENIYEGLVETFPELELDEVEAVLHLIQHLDPIGTGASNLSECLGVQLQTLPADTPYLEEAIGVVKNYIDALGSRNTKLIQRRMDLSEAELQSTIELIQSLNPRPGAQISNNNTEYVVPDVTVVKRGNTWRVELNTDTAPKLRINNTYADLIKRADNSPDNNYMRTQLQEARWFIKSLHSRNETLLRVATSIIEHQRKFLDYGPEAMKPLVLRDIAEELELHESTVSRVTTNKYMHTTRGIFEFKYFFSSHVGTADGGVCSATAIRAMIKKLIEEEDNAKPLSDSKIAKLLDEKGINVARRTVAKYREALSIPPSNERKQL